MRLYSASGAPRLRIPALDAVFLVVDFFDVLPVLVLDADFVAALFLVEVFFAGAFEVFRAEAFRPAVFAELFFAEFFLAELFFTAVLFFAAGRLTVRLRVVAMMAPWCEECADGAEGPGGREVGRSGGEDAGRLDQQELKR